MASHIVDLRNLVSVKEREWKDAVEQRLTQLEEDLQAKEAALLDRETKLDRMKHDFKFNLQLLRDRDAEITRLEEHVTAARRECHERQLGNSESAIALDEARSAIRRLRDDKVSLVEEMDRHAASHLSEIERIRREHEAILAGVRAESANRERCLDLEVVRLRQEVETQKREMMSDAENALAERDREQQANADEMSRRALASELRVQLMEKEVEAVREGRREAQEKLLVAERLIQEAEEQKDTMLLTLRSEIALRDSQVEQLSQAVADKDRELVRAAENAQLQREKMEKAVNEREAALQEMRRVMGEEREEHQRRLDEAVNTFDAAQMEFGQAEWRLQDELKQKILLLEAARAEIMAGKSREEACERRMTEKEARRDGELRNLRVEASERRDEARRLGEQLRVAVERERTAEAAVAQAELETNRRVEEALETERERVDALVSGLVAKTTELHSRLEKADVELSQKDMFVQGLIRERDLALQTLRENGVPFDNRAELRVPNEALAEVQRLSQEVERLRHENVALHNAVEAKETKKEKKKKIEKKNEYQEVEIPKEEGPQDIRHVRDLTALRQERIQLLAQCRKQTVRIQNLEAQGEEVRSQMRAKAAQVDKLEYEVSAGQRQHATETEALKKRVVDLEGQLAECRREADEYYKGNLEHSRIIEGLEQDLAMTRARKHETTPQVNFGGQEIVIQQLQDELENVRSQLRSTLEQEGQTGRIRDEDDATRLRAKLKLAAKKLVRLAEENSVLRQLSSHLRAALTKAGVPIPAAARARPPGASGDAPKSRLAEMERLEYAIMRGRMQGRSHSPPERLPAPSESSESPETETEGEQTIAPIPQTLRPGFPAAQEPLPNFPAAQAVRPDFPASQALRPDFPASHAQQQASPGRNLRRSAASFDPEASLADLWQQLGQMEVDSSQSEAGGLQIRGRAVTPRNTVSRTLGSGREGRQ